MGSRNRNVWIIVAIVLVALCLCTMVVAVAAAGWFTLRSADWGEVSGSESARIERTFEVGDASSLEIDNFAGAVTVRAVEGDAIEVVATKRVRRRSDLDRIEVNMTERSGGLVVETERPFGMSNVSVQLEITAPVGTRLDLHTGSGSVTVRGLSGTVKVDTGSGSVTVADVTGDVDAHSGSGSVEISDVNGAIDARSGSGSLEVHGATGPVRLNTGSGSIEYQGMPTGDCHFRTGSGRIVLTLPADLNMEVDLHTGSGDIDVDFDVDGRVSKGDVKGVIGSGKEGKIYAHTGSGSIDLIGR